MSNLANNWRRSYSRRLFISDALIVSLTVVGAQLTHVGDTADISTRNPLITSPVSYWLFSAFLAVIWLEVLALSGAYDFKIVGAGTEEYKKVVISSFGLFGTVAVFAYLTQIDIARALLLITLPVGIILICFERWLWRQWLNKKRSAGHCMIPILLVGSKRSVLRMAQEFRRNECLGYVIAGACITSRKADIPDLDFPVFDGLENLKKAQNTVHYDSLIITSSDDMTPEEINNLSWEIEPSKGLAFSTSVLGISGPRIHANAITGLPLISVSTPHLSPGQLAGKRLFDLVGSTILIVLLSPVMLSVALAVKLTSTGPILFSHERVGYQGKLFKMHKFRSMRQGADTELKKLLEEQNTAGVPLFKVKDDPRVTRVGKFIRKYSLDELPQLFNVFGGSMSLVGPRPQVTEEVALYTDAAHRRLMLRPGITGLWQVSGRSELDWDQAITLDLYYVENWSLVGDVVIMVKTIKAVAAPGQTAH